MNDSDGIQRSNKVFNSFYRKYTPLVNATVARFYSRDNQHDKIQEFWKNRFCNKTDKELREIDEKGFSYMKVTLKNFLIDEKRRDKRNKKKGDVLRDYFSREKNAFNPFHSDTSAIRKQCESIIRKEFSSPKNYLKVFRLMADGAETKEIAEKTNLKAGNVRTIKCRIRSVLEKELLTSA